MAENTGSRKAPKGAAARAEVKKGDGGKPKPKTLKFRGVELVLPAEMPNTFLFDIIELEANERNPLPTFRFLRDLVPDQFNDIRNQIRPDERAAEVVDGLVTDIFKKYGVDLGE